VPRSARDSRSFAAPATSFTAHAWSQRSTWPTLVPMQRRMRDTPVTPAVPDGPSEPEFRASVRERLGIVAFVVFAAVASAAWLALLVWGIVKVASSF
jgi:hypothetical protein